MSTMRFTGELTIVSCWCGCIHAVPSDMRAYQLREHAAGRKFQIYCPHGHTYIPNGEPEIKRMERELAAERARHDQTQAALRNVRKDRDSAVLRERAQKGAKTKIKNRIHNGVCPCCKKQFKDLAEHMRGRHPAWRGSDEVVA